MTRANRRVEIDVGVFGVRVGYSPIVLIQN